MADDKFPMSIPNVKLINEDFVPYVINLKDYISHEDKFPPDFKEYMLRELTWSRLEISYFVVKYIRWVFWSRQDDEPDPPRLSLTLYDRPNVKDHKIRDALQTIMSFPKLDRSLVQFWAATTTLEGRTLLTTQNQPFALGRTYDPIGLCKYRMISKESIFYGNPGSEEKELGLPGRVFLHKFPISTPDVHCYSIKEYPQREDALRCGIVSSLVVPVFEQFSQICVGVLELVSEFYNVYKWYEKSYLGRVCDVFQKQGLQCFDAYKHYDMQYKDKNEALTTALHELSMVVESVCRMHELPLALTWVPCCKCNDLLRGQLLGQGVHYSNGDYCVKYFLKVSESHHLRREQVPGWALSFPNLVYCSDVVQFSSAEYPLVHYARACSLSDWFAIGLQSSCTGNDVYLLEFFLPDKECENSWTLLTKILGTMKESFKTFKLASGQELGEELPIKVVYFEDGQKLQKLHSVRIAGRSLPSLEPLQNAGEALQQLDLLDQPPMDAINDGMSIISSEQDNFSHFLVISSEKEGIIKTQESQHKQTDVRIKIPLEDILHCSNMSREAASSKLGVSMCTFKHNCRDHGITWWPPHNIEKVSPPPPSHAEHQEGFQQLNSVLPSSQASASVAPKRPRDTAFQDENMVTIRAKYVVEDITIKFQLSLSSGLRELQQQVAKRLSEAESYLEAESYYVKYKDEKGVWIVIACDDDLQVCIQNATSLGNTKIEVLLELK